MRKSTLTATALVAVLALPAAAQANQGFAAVTSGGRLATFSEQSQPNLLSLTPLTSATRHARIVALDRLPSGGLLALDSQGRILDLDLGASRLTPRFGGRAVAGAVQSASSLTFTVANDGASVLVMSRGAARRVDLATGQARPAQASGNSLALDTLPDGRLMGVDGAPRAVVREQEGGGLARLAGLPAPAILQTRFTLAADGATGWLLTRLSARDKRTPQSRWLRVDPQSGAASGQNGPFFLRAFDAVAATGERASVTGRPTVHLFLPRSVSRRRLARDRGLVFSLRSSQGGQTVVSLRDRANRNRGFGFGTTDVPNRRLRVFVASNRSDQRRLGSRFRVHLAVHGLDRDQVRTIDRWVRVTG